MSRHVSLSVHPHHHPSAHTNADKTPIDSCTVRAAAGRAHVGAAAARADAHPCTGTSCCCSADACCCSCLRCHCLLDGRLAVLDAGDGCGQVQQRSQHTHRRVSNQMMRPCTAAWVSNQKGPCGRVVLCDTTQWRCASSCPAEPHTPHHQLSSTLLKTFSTYKPNFFNPPTQIFNPPPPQPRNSLHTTNHSPAL